MKVLMIILGMLAIALSGPANHRAAPLVSFTDVTSAVGDVYGGPRKTCTCSRAVHKDFSRSLAENDWETVLTGASVGLSPTTHVESPGFTVNTTGGTANESQTAGLIVTIGTPTGKTIKPLLGVNVGPIPAGNDPRNADLTTAYQQSWR